MRRAPRLGNLLLATVLVVGCAAPAATFTPNGPCVADGRAAGSYPELELLVPRALGEDAAVGVDSGRSCTVAALGTYASHGITELRFAGATWDEGEGDATAIAIVTTPGSGPALNTTWVEEFYTAGALNGKHTENTKTSRPTMTGVGAVFRLETLNDLSQQTVVIWPGGSVVHVVIVATRVTPDASLTEHERRVAVAVEAAAAVVLSPE